MTDLGFEERVGLSGGYLQCYKKLRQKNGSKSGEVVIISGLEKREHSCKTMWGHCFGN